jgi:malonyl-CoA decarboxylase
LARLRDTDQLDDVFNEAPGSEEIRPLLLSLAAQYLLVSRSNDDRPVDPVARFHLGNGARLERLNWLADTSERGLRDGLGLMVNYRYEPGEIERNHEAYAQDGTIAASRSVKALLKSGSKVKGLAAVPDLLALPGASKAKRARSTGVE